MVGIMSAVACPSPKEPVRVILGHSCERPPRSLRSRLPLARGRLSHALPLEGGDGAEGAEGGRSRTQFRITWTEGELRIQSQVSSSESSGRRACVKTKPPI